jgi:hypothetical protein
LFKTEIKVEGEYVKGWIRLNGQNKYMFFPSEFTFAEAAVLDNDELIDIEEELADVRRKIEDMNHPVNCR